MTAFRGRRQASPYETPLILRFSSASGQGQQMSGENSHFPMFSQSISYSYHPHKIDFCLNSSESYARCLNFEKSGPRTRAFLRVTYFSSQTFPGRAVTSLLIKWLNNNSSCKVTCVRISPPTLHTFNIFALATPILKGFCWDARSLGQKKHFVFPQGLTSWGEENKPPALCWEEFGVACWKIYSTLGVESISKYWK